MKPAFDLVVFDCDGVLVDSEMLSAGVLMGMMEEIGLPITDSIFREDFLGRSFANAAERAAQRFGRDIPDDFQLRYRDRLLVRIEKHLQVMPDIEAAIKSLKVQICLATSSSPQRLAASLEKSNLKRYFDGRCFTATQVQHGKPAPDLFLLAFASMGFKPERCLIIEDSEMGVRAGLAAAAEVWQFAGGSHVKAGYQLPPDLKAHRIIDDAKALLSAFQEIGLCG
jgi:HAD superfamily hydrolase (TIGR01509 family)